MADPALAAAARTALDNPTEATPPPPPWANALGRAAARECFTVDDELGDATQVIMSFAYADEQPHAVVVLVDHNLGDLAKDIWVTDDAAGLLGQVRTTVADDPDMRLAQVEPADLKPVLLGALAASDDSVDPPVTDTFRQLRALLAARARALPDGGSGPEPPAWTDEQRDELVRDFLAAPEVVGLPAASAEAIAVELVGYGCDHDRGLPLRVSTTKLEVFTLGWLPMTGLLDDEHVEHMTSVLPAYVRFAGRRTGLSETSLAETLEGAETVAAQFEEAYDDASRWGPARIAVEAMLSDIDPDSDDADEVFARRMFALPRVPGEDFDPAEEDSFLAVVEEEHPEYGKVLAEPDADPMVERRQRPYARRDACGGRPPAVVQRPTRGLANRATATRCGIRAAQRPARPGPRRISPDRPEPERRRHVVAGGVPCRPRRPTGVVGEGLREGLQRARLSPLSTVAVLWTMLRGT